MVYTKQTWTDGAPPPEGEINADRLAYMEEGIQTAQETADAVGSAGYLRGAIASQVFTRSGSLVISAGTGRLLLDAAATVVGVTAIVDTAPTGASIIIDVNKNGVTLFTTQGERPTITAGTNVTATAAVPDITSLVAGDYLTVDVDQVGSTINGANLTVQVFLI